MQEQLGFGEFLDAGANIVNIRIDSTGHKQDLRNLRAGISESKLEVRDPDPQSRLLRPRQSVKRFVLLNLACSLLRSRSFKQSRSRFGGRCLLLEHSSDPAPFFVRHPARRDEFVEVSGWLIAGCFDSSASETRAEDVEELLDADPAADVVIFERAFRHAAVVIGSRDRVECDGSVASRGSRLNFDWGMRKRFEILRQYKHDAGVRE